MAIRELQLAQHRRTANPFIGATMLIVASAVEIDLRQATPASVSVARGSTSWFVARLVLP